MESVPGFEPGGPGSIPGGGAMAYVYICDRCRADEHDECEDHKGSGMGVGICVCSHTAIGPRPKFEDYVWRRDV